MNTMAAHDASGPVDLAALARHRHGPIPLWAEQSTDLHVNLMRLDPGAGIAEHVNTELDVLLVGVTGEGRVDLAGVRYTLAPGSAILLPKNMRRAIESGDQPFSYLSCHRRRALLWPTASRPADTASEGNG